MQDKSAFKAKLAESEEWLYSDEGFDTTKVVYQEKLNNLMETGEQPVRREKESHLRPQATSDLLSAIEKFKSIGNSMVNKSTYFNSC